MSRLSFGLRPSSQALRAWTTIAAAPAAFTASTSPNKASRGSCVVDADAAFDGDGNGDRADHRRHAFGDQSRLAHQAGAETAALHAVGRAAAVQIDLVIAKIGADAGGLGEARRIGAAELQGDRMLRRDRSRATARAARTRSRPPSPFRCKAAPGASGCDGTSDSAGPTNPSSGRRKSVRNTVEP